MELRGERCNLLLSVRGGLPHGCYSLTLAHLFPPQVMVQFLMETTGMSKEAIEMEIDRETFLGKQRNLTSPMPLPYCP